MGTNTQELSARLQALQNEMRDLKPKLQEVLANSYARTSQYGKNLYGRSNLFLNTKLGIGLTLFFAVTKAIRLVRGLYNKFFKRVENKELSNEALFGTSNLVPAAAVAYKMADGLSLRQAVLGIGLFTGREAFFLFESIKFAKSTAREVGNHGLFKGVVEVFKAQVAPNFK